MPPKKSSASTTAKNSADEPQRAVPAGSVPKKEENSSTASEVNGSSSEATTMSNGSSSSSKYPRFLGVIPYSPWLLFIVLLVPFCYVLFEQSKIAMRYRMHAIRDFGYVIHEFDPWFNFRATQYLSKHGWHAFFHWYDNMSWYPLGRPVGTTIYPGLQITAVGIHRALRYLGKPYQMSLNNVCCLIPVWFGAVATVMTSLLTYECSGSLAAGAVTSAIMAIIPAHIMRSVGGGFDNECIAVSAMVITFYLWVRSVRDDSSWAWGVLTGLAYGYMVAAWGGFIFVLNLIVLHAALLALMDMLRGDYSPGLFKAYALFYIIGTAIATCVPPVSMMPFKSLEQLSATFVFLVLLALHLSEGARQSAGAAVHSFRALGIRIKYIGACLAGVALVAAMLMPTGFFGPLSSRVRALFVQHTLTGNPLVDSVAEHNPANADAYWQFLHYTYYGWMAGSFAAPILIDFSRWRGGVFLLAYSVVAYYFSLKMSRMIILTAPVVSALCGVLVGGGFDFGMSTFVEYPGVEGQPLPDPGRGAGIVSRLSAWSTQLYSALRKLFSAAFVLGLALLYQHRGKWKDFEAHSSQMAVHMSEPQIMFKHHDRQTGRMRIIDDYREGYFWLRDKTPQDSRVLSWWDYGYQITGIGNRTTLADGNTWNHEHIATIGYMLSSPQDKAHKLIRHVADYVLVWAGGMGDDLGKSPHMARIGNSVYRDICSLNDPLCHAFSFMDNSYDRPTKMMRESLLYNAVMHNVKAGVRVNPKLYREAYTSKHGLIRIFEVLNVSQASKQWLADPENWDCDAPGSWYCPGRYPNVTVWRKLLAKRHNFAQLEDFSKKRSKDDDRYYKAYMDEQKRMGRGG